MAERKLDVLWAFQANWGGGGGVEEGAGRFRVGSGALSETGWDVVGDE